MTARVAPAAGRNREPILAVLRGWLPQAGLVLEVASGSGEHAVWFAGALPGLTWQPTDRDEAALASIAAWRVQSGLANVQPPALLDASAPASWPVARADAIVAINMIHISPWASTLGLMAGAARVLTPGGVLFLYGPYRVGGAHTAPSNADFDASLRARDAKWGVRDLEDVAAAADAAGLDLAAQITMPANNFSVVFRKRAG
jgi:SAM-dependent methyltransferase